MKNENNLKEPESPAVAVDTVLAADADITHLLSLLAKHGGSIISSNELPSELINQARAANRMYVDVNSLGYVWEPPFAGRFPETEDEVIMFDWCYPLDVQIPERLKDSEWIKRIIERRM